MTDTGGDIKDRGGKDVVTEQDLLRQIPSVSELLGRADIRELSDSFGGGLVKSEIQLALKELRAELRGGGAVPDGARFAALLRRRLLRFTSPEGRHAVNAAGILLHTGLGRSPLCKEALEALSGMGGYSLLQSDLASGGRSLREEKVERLLIELTGCEAATVVNNNAAATMLALNTLAAGKRVILSRGQLIEIGGGFRMPEVMARSSVTLHEVGTTNRTHLQDYEKAVDENTGAILHVHTSNYRVRGFSGTPDIRALCALGKKLGIPVMDDIGSGALVPLSKFGVTDEPLVSESLLAGAEIICFSGDKLICGPQAGIICGKKEIIARVRKNPFARMFRVCKLTLAALEATLIHFVNGTHGEALPFYQMLSVPLKTLEDRAQNLMRATSALKGVRADIIDDVSYVGSGSLPDEGVPTKVVRVRFDKTFPGYGGIEQAALRLRQGLPSIFCRVKEDSLYCDMRTLFDGEEMEIAKGIRLLAEDISK